MVYYLPCLSGALDILLPCLPPPIPLLHLHTEGQRDWSSWCVSADADPSENQKIPCTAGWVLKRKDPTCLSTKYDFYLLDTQSRIRPCQFLETDCITARLSCMWQRLLSSWAWQSSTSPVLITFARPQINPPSDGKESSLHWMATEWRHVPFQNNSWREGFPVFEAQRNQMR